VYDIGCVFLIDLVQVNLFKQHLLNLLQLAQQLSLCQRVLDFFLRLGLRAFVVVLGFCLLLVQLYLSKNLLKDNMLALLVQQGMVVNVQQHEFAEPLGSLVVADYLVVVFNLQVVGRALGQKAF
jgi:hypothetical protein